MLQKKVKIIDELKIIIRDLHQQKKKVVLANGVFDLLHVGHIRYLQSAKTYGDILIVALNSDSSTKLNKGNNRPITPELERAELLSAISVIDFIVIFSEKDVKKILLELKPDYQAKGKDYTVDSVPEKEIVESYGGKVIITGDEKNHSSSEIIKKLHNGCI